MSECATRPIWGLSRMLVGYMRVSTADERQSVDYSATPWSPPGWMCYLHQDRQSGSKDDRPGLKACLADLREGDVLVVWELDRLGRSLSRPLGLVTELKGRGSPSASSPSRWTPPRAMVSSCSACSAP